MRQNLQEVNWDKIMDSSVDSCDVLVAYQRVGLNGIDYQPVISLLPILVDGAAAGAITKQK